MPRRLLTLLAPGLAPLAPPACWSCGVAARHGEPLCDGCDAELPWLGERLGASPPAPPGGRAAQLDALGLDALWTPLAFEGPARELVHALKFRGAAGLARAMARDVLEGAPRDLLAAPAALVPVPAHPWRRRVRGFDHAAALAGALGALSGRPVLAALERGGRPGSRQRGLPRAQRLAAVGLDVRPRAGQVPRSAVLVDDVCTTGATLAACAGALRAGGASSVAAIAYARTL